jgi:ABC-type polysaccharide/polyol phosphate transport system ATPase subunit
MEKTNRISVKNISKNFKIGFQKNQSVLARFVSFFSGREPKKVLEALKDVSFEVFSGEILGIIGDNGSGKSSLLRIISGIYKQDGGQITKNGKIISLINLGAGLKERLTMKDNIYLTGALFGLDNFEIGEILKSIADFSGLEKFLNTKLYQFSNGMMQRLVFSIAVHSKPDILLLDEVFEVGDEDFKKKSAEKIKELIGSGASVILVSHDLELIKKYCNTVLCVNRGEIIGRGVAKEIVDNYLSDR